MWTVLDIDERESQKFPGLSLHSKEVGRRELEAKAKLIHPTR